MYWVQQSRLLEKANGAGTLKIQYSHLDQLDDIIAKLSRK